MAQARTCEEYVIQELYHKDAVIESHLIRIEELKKQLEAALDKIQDLKDVIDIFKPSIYLSCDSSAKYIGTDTVWSSYDPVQYNFIRDLLDLEEPKTEVEETSENV